MNAHFHISPAPGEHPNKGEQGTEGSSVSRLDLDLNHPKGEGIRAVSSAGLSGCDTTDSIRCSGGGRYSTDTPLRCSNFAYKRCLKSDEKCYAGDDSYTLPPSARDFAQVGVSTRQAMFERRI